MRSSYKRGGTRDQERNTEAGDRVEQKIGAGSQEQWWGRGPLSQGKIASRVSKSPPGAPRARRRFLANPGHPLSEQPEETPNT